MRFSARNSPQSSAPRSGYILRWCAFRSSRTGSLPRRTSRQCHKVGATPRPSPPIFQKFGRFDRSIRLGSTAVFLSRPDCSPPSAVSFLSYPATHNPFPSGVSCFRRSRRSFSRTLSGDFARVDVQHEASSRGETSCLTFPCCRAYAKTRG
jgi:hypothetical protein